MKNSKIQPYEWKLEYHKMKITLLVGLLAGLLLSDHFKSGQRLSLQNRPTGLAVQD